MIDRYVDRPNSSFLNGKCSILDRFCYAEFLAHYYLLPKTSNDSVNDSQPAVLEELLLEINHNACNYPSTIPLMNSKEKLKCRKVKTCSSLLCTKSIQVSRKICAPSAFSVLFFSQ